MTPMMMEGWWKVMTLVVMIDDRDRHVDDGAGEL